MIYFLEDNDVIYLAISGHMKAQFCTKLKQEVFSILDSKRIEKIYIDFSDCTYMDSTFIGTITGINKKFKKMYLNKITLQNITKECKSILEDMGVYSLFSIQESPIGFPKNLIPFVDNEKTTADDVLKAHEDLIEISKKNEERFGLLCDTLKKSTKN